MIAYKPLEHICTIFAIVSEDWTRLHRRIPLHRKHAPTIHRQHTYDVVAFCAAARIFCTNNETDRTIFTRNRRKLFLPNVHIFSHTFTHKHTDILMHCACTSSSHIYCMLYARGMWLGSTHAAQCLLFPYDACLFRDNKRTLTVANNDDDDDAQCGYLSAWPPVLCCQRAASSSS